MCEKPKDMLDEMAELSDDQLAQVVGGLTDGDRRTLREYIKRCKLKGYSLSDTLTELQNTYSSPRSARYLNDYIEFVCENW